MTRATRQPQWRVCRECHPAHIENCDKCFGYGLYVTKTGSRGPVNAYDAWMHGRSLDSDVLVDCERCGSGIEGYDSRR